MATVPFIIERQLQYCGIWNAGYNIGDLFYKLISKEFTSKPAYPAFLRLSSSSLVLTVFKRGTPEPETIRTDSIPFEAVREIAVNAFNNRCLMIIYVNNKNKFSVIVSSCRDGKETLDIAAAFKRLQTMAVIKKTQAHNSNWIMRKTNEVNGNNNEMNDDDANIEPEKSKLNDDNNNDSSEIIGGVDETDSGLPGSQDEDVSSVKSRTDSRVLSDNFAFLEHEQDLSFDEDSIFDDDEIVDKEEGPGENSMSVGLQVDVAPTRPDRVSISSESSLSSFQDITKEIDHISQDSSISEEEYFKRKLKTDENENKNSAQFEDQVDAGRNSDASNGDIPHVNGTDEEINGEDGNNDEGNAEVIKAEKTEDFDIRSVGIQTDYVKVKLRPRYTKRPGSSGTSNMYRNLAAQRKHKHNPQSTHTSSPSAPQFNSARSRPSSFVSVPGGQIPIQSLYLPRNVSVSTVSRPIEKVYHSKTWSKRSVASTRKRQVLMMSSGRNSLRI